MKSVKLMMLSASLSLTLLSGCAANTTAPPAAPSSYCLIAKGIGYASQPPGAVETADNLYDTPLTIAAVEAHNLAYEAVCQSKE